MTTIDRGATPATPATADPVQDALTGLVSAREQVERLTGEYLDHAQQAALTGGQVPAVVAEQTLLALIGLSNAIGAFEATAAPRWHLRQAQHVTAGDTIRLPGEDEPAHVLQVQTFPPEGNYFGGGVRLWLVGRSTERLARLARVEILERPTVDAPVDLVPTGLHLVDDYFAGAPVVAEPCPVPGCDGRIDGSGCDFGVHEMVRQADLAKALEQEQRAAMQDARHDAEGERS